MSKTELNKLIRRRNVAWYGPYDCNGCGATIVKSSIKIGGIMLNAPHGHHYPNHDWKKHVCKKVK